MTVCRLSIKIHFFVNSIKFPLPRRGARLGCDDKVKNAENLPVMFLIFRKRLNLTNKTEEKHWYIVGREVWWGEGYLGSQSFPGKKCKIIEGGWGGVKNLKPGLINNGAFYIQWQQWYCDGKHDFGKIFNSHFWNLWDLQSAQISTSIFFTSKYVSIGNSRI